MIETIAIESPYAGQIARNISYLNQCILDCLARGEAPYASHAYIVNVLNDRDGAERRQGISAGLAISSQLDQRCFYIDYGWSGGMIDARRHYIAHGLSFIERSIL